MGMYARCSPQSDCANSGVSLVDRNPALFGMVRRIVRLVGSNTREDRQDGIKGIRRASHDFVIIFGNDDPPRDLFDQARPHGLSFLTAITLVRQIPLP